MKSYYIIYEFDNCEVAIRVPGANKSDALAAAMGRISYDLDMPFERFDYAKRVHIDNIEEI